ncbi:unnamed protein product [Ectocarpus sp. 12 AP-2014]
MGKPSLDLVSVNRKTEICRNWQQGRCVAEAWKCAFAHGTHELRRQSLDMMEYTGRIPNASKFRCYPCLTWITTGACPYFSRCVFIHDPRIRGPTAAYLYKHNGKRSHSSRSGGSVGSPLGRDIFYWPDMPRTDADDNEVWSWARSAWMNVAQLMIVGVSSLPTVSVDYDMDPSMLHSEDATERAVYQLWYSLVSTITEIREQQNPLVGIGSVHEASYHRNDSFFNAPPSGGALHIWRDPCQVCCESADLPEISPEIVPVTVPATVPRPLRARTGGGGGTSVQHAPPSFPLADIDPRSALSLEARTPARATRKEQPVWRLNTATGVENQRPKQSTGPGGVPGSPCPRRSTAPAALGRSRDATPSSAGLNTARGLTAELGTRTSLLNTQGDNQLRNVSDIRMKEGQRNASWEDVVRSALFEDDDGTKEAASNPPTQPSFSSTTTSESHAPGFLPWYDGTSPYGDTEVQSSEPTSYPSGGGVESARGDYLLPPSTGTSSRDPSLDLGTADDYWSASSQQTSFSPCGAPGHPGASTGASSYVYDPRNLSCQSDGGGGGEGISCAGGVSHVSQTRRTTTYPFGAFAEGM